MFYIALDAMGGDFAPAEALKGCAAALNTREGFGVIVTGKRDVIERELPGCGMAQDYLESKRLVILHSSQVIINDESPTAAIKEKKDSSMVTAIKLVKEGSASAIVSAGNTGALLTGGLTMLGRVKGIQRPALGVMLPGKGKNCSFLIDAGANVDCKAAYLVQFARMGSIYAENMHDIESPRVGLVNVGAEKEKGSAVVKETYELLENLKLSGELNFVGNLEARDIPYGKADVVVCDGFVGNVILKHYEGLSMSLLETIKRELAGVSSEVKAAAGSALSKIIKHYDAREIGGAPFLGLEGLVVKAHGNSDATAFMNAIFQAVTFTEKNTLERFAQIMPSV